MRAIDHEELQKEARSLRPILDRQARRPFVVEITGTPKAGKTTTIRMLAAFFKGAGWKVDVVTERAAQCPLVMKGHFFFNTWTSCTTLAELVDAVHRDRHLVILDRGLFDSLIWLRLQRRRKQVTQEEYETFSRFVCLDRWSSLQDACFVVTALPSVAMDREQDDQLVFREGSLMNEESLAELNGVIEECVREYGQTFGPTLHDASKVGVRESVATLAKSLVAQVGAQSNPGIFVVPRTSAETLFEGRESVAWSPEAWRSLATTGVFEIRSTAETRTDVVQIVAAGVQISDGQVYLIDRSDTRKREKFGRYAIWKGAHVDTASEAEVGVEVLRDVLLTRLRSDLHLAAFECEPRPLGFVWTAPADPDEAPHLAVVFEVQIEDPSLAEHLRDKAFKSRGQIQPVRLSMEEIEKLVGSDDSELEPWSKAILEAGWLRRDK